MASCADSVPARDKGATHASSANGRSGNRVFEQFYSELRALAAHHLGRERSDHTLQPTALVHEAYLRLAVQSNSSNQGRTRFLSLASEMIRRILVDHARERNALKRVGKRKRHELDGINIPELSEKPIDILDLDSALTELGALSPRQAQVIEQRFFGGLSVAETARSLEISEGSVKNDWRFARAWLCVRLKR